LKLWDYKVWHQGYRQWHDAHAEFLEYLQIGSKVISGDTDSMVISSLSSFLWKVGLQNYCHKRKDKIGASASAYWVLKNF
jgi:hypothetical protein